jgi:sporulation protein YlmC with PRC-barrel domain
MPDTVQLLLGAEVACTDGVCGLVHSLVVDPRARRVTHLVAEPKHRIGLGRLVPLGLVTSADSEVQLSCDLAAFDALPHAESTSFEPDLQTYYGYFSIPGPPAMEAEVNEVLPPGEVAEHTGEPVSATDGPIGVVAGLVIDAAHHDIVQVLVSEERLLFGHKVIAVPISAVTSLKDGVKLNLATAEVGR